ncbi:hypothetical protein [Methylomicrobium sp. Wu6]|uniref:hypothetical protein n=1 Tax=Methylomicrobium sp. Wu6 TaxID=3107928 RepID=UPI002DD69F59|nr:hypothetical protein [Methylomicrobium sp. Wu6]MEC4747726.1 hypothetical protein [Methylomicrobium sp. Wu6]
MTTSKDGRSKYATGRTHQFATRVTEEFHREFKTVAAREGLSMTVLLEKCLDAYLKQGGKNETLLDHFKRASKAEKKELLKLIRETD